MQPEWQTINSREIHRNPWYRVMQDDIVMPSGQQGKYTYIDRLTAVVIAALTADNELYLVGQYRYPIKKFSWELPKGTIEKSDADLLESAQHELLEEVGLAAKSWEDIGSYFLDIGLTNQLAHLYLARDLEQKQALPDYTEFLSSKKVNLSDMEELIRKNEIVDNNTIAAFYKLKLFLEKK